jgi:hypothetical protein
MTMNVAASPEPVIKGHVAELRQEATDARRLASTIAASSAVRDLLSYASALEADAECWEQAFSPFLGGLMAGRIGRLH